MRFSIILAAVATLALAGCNEPYVPPVQTWGYDQCIRASEFKQCMASLPKGPQTIAGAGNDWDEVVEACSDTARKLSVRKLTVIKPECSQ